VGRAGAEGGTRSGTQKKKRKAKGGHLGDAPEGGRALAGPAVALGPVKRVETLERIWEEERGQRGECLPSYSFIHSDDGDGGPGGERLRICRKGRPRGDGVIMAS